MNNKIKGIITCTLQHYRHDAGNENSAGGSPRIALIFTHNFFMFFNCPG